MHAQIEVATSPMRVRGSAYRRCIVRLASRVSSYSLRAFSFPTFKTVSRCSWTGQLCATHVVDEVESLHGVTREAEATVHTTSTPADALLLQQHNLGEGQSLRPAEPTHDVSRELIQ